MSLERLKNIKETLMCAVEGQIYNLEEVDAEELGEVVDMIKDIEETIYYCTVVKAMEEGSEKGQREEVMYYTPYRKRMAEDYPVWDQGMDWSSGPHYYGGNRSGMNNSNSTSGNSNGGNNSGNGMSGGNRSSYTEREFPNAFQDPREGKSYRSRRTYMEAKETRQDKTTQMKELERYVQELTQDMVEMVQDASAEERQYLGKKIAALSNKITQLNDQH